LESAADWKNDNPHLSPTELLTELFERFPDLTNEQLVWVVNDDVEPTP